MTLVLLGTQNNSFHRLLEEVQKNIDNGNIKDEVIVQKGYTKFESPDMKIYDQVSAEKMKEIENKNESKMGAQIASGKSRFNNYTWRSRVNYNCNWARKKSNCSPTFKKV